MANRDAKLTFEQWMAKVNGLLNATVGMSAEDLGDQEWRVWYDDEVTPRGAAGMCLEDEGYGDLIPEEWREDM